MRCTTYYIALDAVDPIGISLLDAAHAIYYHFTECEYIGLYNMSVCVGCALCAVRATASVHCSPASTCRICVACLLNWPFDFYFIVIWLLNDCRTMCTPEQIRWTINTSNDLLFSGITLLLLLMCGTLTADACVKQQTRDIPWQQSSLGVAINYGKP